MLTDTRNNTSLSLISIYEISKILTSSFHLEKTLYEVLNLLSSYMQMRDGMVSLVGSNGALNVVAAQTLTQAAMRKQGARLSQGVSGRILSTGMPVVVPDLAQEPSFTDHDAPNGLLDGEIVSFIGVPIKVAGKPAGVLSIDRIWEPGNLPVNFEADVRFLTMVANLIGQTVRLHQSVASERERLLQEQNHLQKVIVAAQPASPVSFALDQVIGTSRRMQEVAAEIHQAAPSRTTVLLRGESGTGKELFARAVHHLSSRKNGAFIKVNCAALSESLLESELFGHEKGAFTGAQTERKGRFELANGGTLFLDEIGEISLSFQAKLLRVLQEGELERVGGSKTIKVDVRLVCATNRNLEEMVSKNTFRADLYYRINVVPIFLPPLRDRKEDIPALIEHFLHKFNSDNGRDVAFSEGIRDALCNCYFPGNVRELENCVNRAATMARSDVVRNGDLPCQKNLCLSAQLWKDHRPATPELHAPVTPALPAPPALPVAPTVAPPLPPSSLIDEDDLVDSLDRSGGGDEFTTAFDDLPAAGQRDRLIRAMEKTGWVQAKAARLLNLTPRQIGYALKKYNIEVKRL